MVDLKVPREVLLDDDGRIIMPRWYHYWRAILSAPTQPGYGQLVRYAVRVNDQLATFYKNKAIDLGIENATKAGEELSRKMEMLRRISLLPIPDVGLYDLVSVPLAMRTSPLPLVLDVVVLQDAVLAGEGVEVHTWGEHAQAQIAAVVDDVGEVGSAAMEKIEDALAAAAEVATEAAGNVALGLGIAAGLALVAYAIHRTRK